MSADPVPSTFPNRPIRPLPKRRLRERLSPEVAESIQYPPAPQALVSLFPYPYTLREEEHDSNLGSTRNRGSEVDHRPARRNGLGAGEDSGSALRGHAGRDTPPSARMGRHQTKVGGGGNSHAQPPLSSASSLDGYDQHEGSNNKKKRKIPIAGESALNGALSLIDNHNASPAVDQSAETNRDALLPSTAAAYGTGSFGSSGQNIAGPGRGRYGRSRSARSPLRPLPDSTSNHRNGKVRPFPWTAGTNESTGIISDAIAKAEKLPLPQGQENTSLLQQQLSNKRGPTSTQFTFTCSSQVPGSLAWPGADRRILPPGYQATSTRHNGDNWAHGPQTQQTGQPPVMPTNVDATSKDASSQGRVPSPTTAPKPTRRSLARELETAAKTRRQETLAKNRRNPPKREDVWLCHFCEYEAIWGTPPLALIRQYEIKDRKQRQLEQQRKAQWERLKKGKHKGKKNSKLPAKNNDAVHESHPGVGPHGGGMNSNYSQGTQSDEYYDEDEEYDDGDDAPDEDPPDDGSGTHERPIIARPEPPPPPFVDGGGT